MVFCIPMDDIKYRSLELIKHTDILGSNLQYLLALLVQICGVVGFWKVTSMS